MILRNLSRRPNVQSTLILSRKDGSIIRASGDILEHRHNEIETRRQADNASSVDDSSAVLTEAPRIRNELKPTYAQILASNIHMFVLSATALSASVSSVDRQARMSPRRNEEDKEADEGRHLSNTAEADIQLLRLRLKRQEVIIFPDTKYLCCVIQDLEKSAG